MSLRPRDALVVDEKVIDGKRLTGRILTPDSPPVERVDATGVVRRKPHQPSSVTMDILLVRLAGAPRPSVETLRAALLRQPWLTPEAGRRGVWSRLFAFAGGHVQVATRLRDEPRYETPGLHVTLAPDADFATVAPRLVALAGELRLGIDSPRSSGSLWWQPPHPSALEPGHVDRAVATSRHCEGREPKLRSRRGLAGVSLV